MGLGLAIVRRLAQLLGHRIEVTSTVGRGSRFRVVAGRPPHRRPVALRGRSLRAVAGVRLGRCAGGGDRRRLRRGGCHVRAVRHVGYADDRRRGRANRCCMRSPPARWCRISSSRTCASPGARTASTRSTACATNWANRCRRSSSPGDTSSTAERAARAAGLVLLAKPVVPAVLQGVATALVVRALPGRRLTKRRRSGSPERRRRVRRSEETRGQACAGAAGGCGAGMSLRRLVGRGRAALARGPTP